jgi:hypothetical protein
MHQGCRFEDSASYPASMSSHQSNKYAHNEIIKCEREQKFSVCANVMLMNLLKIIKLPNESSIALKDDTFIYNNFIQCLLLVPQEPGAGC